MNIKKLHEQLNNILDEEFNSKDIKSELMDRVNSKEMEVKSLMKQKFNKLMNNKFDSNFQTHLNKFNELISKINRDFNEANRYLNEINSNSTDEYTNRANTFCIAKVKDFLSDINRVINKKLNEEVENILIANDDNLKNMPIFSGPDEWPLIVELKRNKKGYFVTYGFEGDVEKTKIFKTAKEALDAYIEVCIEEDASSDLIYQMVDWPFSEFHHNDYSNYVALALENYYYETYKDEEEE